MHTLSRIIRLLTAKELARGALVLSLLIGMALLEAAGVASVMPFLAVVGDQDLINTNSNLQVIFNYSTYLGVKSDEDFLIFLGLAAFLMIVSSAGYRIYTFYAMNNYVEMRRHSLGMRLLENYLRQPYTFFLKRNSGDMSKNILSELDAIIGGVIRPVFAMLANVFVVLAITILLLFN